MISSKILSVGALLTSLMATSVGAHAAETCEKPSPAGIRRCTSKIGPPANIEMVTYFDRSHDTTDLEITFDLKGDTKVATGFVESAMIILLPDAGAATISSLFRKLAENAVKGENKFITQGRYQWASARIGNDRMLFRAVKDKTLQNGSGASVGMSASDVLRSKWGKPLSINKTVTASGSHEQWVYSGGYIYFDNGIVTAVETTKKVR